MSKGTTLCAFLKNVASSNEFDCPMFNKPT